MILYVTFFFLRDFLPWPQSNLVITGDTGGGGGANSSRSYFGGDTAINQGAKQICSENRKNRNGLCSDQALHQSDLGFEKIS